MKYLKQYCPQGIFTTPEIQEIYCITFADDVACCADTAANLQTQLDAIEKFCEETKMIVNLKKSEIIVFRNGRPLRAYKNWKFRGESIKVKPYYKYMGLLFTPKLSWSMATKSLQHKH